jgi:hydrogenase nickel incorporation protein HypA/HybF
MHELSIAASIVEIAAAHARGRRVAGVYVKIGHLRQVVPSALAFSFQLVAEGTVVEGARLEIEHVAVEGRCRRCAAVSRPTSFPLLCGSCGATDLEILAGEELLVDSLDIEDKARDLEEV